MSIILGEIYKPLNAFDFT